MKPGYK